MNFQIHREKALDSDNFWVRIEITTDGGKRISAEGLPQKVIFFKYGEPSTREKMDLAEFILRHADEAADVKEERRKLSKSKDYPRPDSDGAL